MDRAANPSSPEARELQAELARLDAAWNDERVALMDVVSASRIHCEQLAEPSGPRGAMGFVILGIVVAMAFLILKRLELAILSSIVIFGFAAGFARYLAARHHRYRAALAAYEARRQEIEARLRAAGHR